MEGIPAAGAARAEKEPYTDGIGPVLELIADLNRISPEAYDLWGGDAERWRLERRSLADTPQEWENLGLARESVERLVALASTEQTGDWRQRIEREADNYHFALYGVHPTVT